MLTGMLNGTQTLRDGMIGLFSSLTQSVIKNLVDMAAQALITNTILKSIMGIGGSLLAAQPPRAPARPSAVLVLMRRAVFMTHLH